MKYRQCPTRRPRRHSLGLTLVEMMVSLTIGLVIVVAVLSAYLGSATAGKVTQAQVRMNEDAQAALTILSQQLRMAGNNPIQGNRLEATQRNPIYLPSAAGFSFTSAQSLTTAFAVRGCDSNFTHVGSAKKPDDMICGHGAASTRSDSIAVTYEADRFNTISTNAGSPTDCLGNELTPQTVQLAAIVGSATETVAVSYAVADNRFYIDHRDSDPKNAPSLYCRGNGGGRAQPLVENIENLQFEYGLFPPNSTDPAEKDKEPTHIAGYLLTAADVVTHPKLATSTESERWRKVKAIRICVVARSENPVVNDLASAQYRGCDGNMVKNPPDLRMRRAYTKTVILRNPE